MFPLKKLTPKTPSNDLHLHLLYENKDICPPIITRKAGKVIILLWEHCHSKQNQGFISEEEEERDIE